MEVTKFIEWLRKEGYDVTETNLLRRPDGFYINLAPDNPDEEQPELLCWCLKELERREPMRPFVIGPLLVDLSLTINEEQAKRLGYEGCVNKIVPNGQYSCNGHFGATMTQAATQALVGGDNG